MNVLALDTSTELLSVALRSGTPPRTASVTRETPAHVASLMGAVEEVLRSQALPLRDVDLVVCTRGPGSFTGLRIGMATAKGLSQAILALRSSGLAADARPPLVSVPTLDATAWHLATLVPVVLAVIDAKKGRFYAALFRDGIRQGADLDMEPGALATRAADVSEGRRVVVTGPHSEAFVLAAGTDRFVADRASRRGCAVALLELGIEQLRLHGHDEPSGGPSYVRSPDARPPSS